MVLMMLSNRGEGREREEDQKGDSMRGRTERETDLLQKEGERQDDEELRGSEGERRKQDLKHGTTRLNHEVRFSSAGNAYDAVIFVILVASQPLSSLQSGMWSIGPDYQVWLSRVSWQPGNLFSCRDASLRESWHVALKQQ